MTIATDKRSKSKGLPGGILKTTRQKKSGGIKPIERAVQVLTESEAGVGTVFTRMGRLLNQKVQSESDVVRIVTVGLPAKSFKHLSDKLHVDLKLVGPESTVRRRVQENMRFTTDESERMVRMARVYSLAVELFRDENAAKTWLDTRAPYLSGEDAITPLELSVTDSGARMVEAMLLRTAHGVF